MSSFYFILFISLWANGYAEVISYDGGYNATKSGNCELWKMDIVTNGEDGSFFGQSLEAIVDCTLDFQASPDYDRIYIRFETYGAVRTECSTNYMLIGDNRRCFSELTGQNDYFQLPLSIRYHTEGRQKKTAMQAFYTFIKLPIPSCDEDIVNPKGEIKSPGFPKIDSKEKTCRFTFDSQIGYVGVHLSIKTLDFGGELNSDCSHAKLTIDGKEYCDDRSNYTIPILLLTPIQVTFQQSKFPIGNGFEIKYEYIPIQ